MSYISSLGKKFLFYAKWSLPSFLRFCYCWYEVEVKKGKGAEAEQS